MYVGVLKSGVRVVLSVYVCGFSVFVRYVPADVVNAVVCDHDSCGCVHVKPVRWMEFQAPKSLLSDG